MSLTVVPGTPKTPSTLSVTPKPDNFISGLWETARVALAFSANLYMNLRLNHFTAEHLDEYCHTLDETSGKGLRSAVCSTIAAYGTDIILYQTKYPDSPFFNLEPGEKKHSEDWLFFCNIAYKIATKNEKHLELIISTLLTKAFKNLTDDINEAEIRTPHLSAKIAKDLITHLTVHLKKVGEVEAGKGFTEREGLHPAMPLEGMPADDAYELRQKNFFVPLARHILFAGLPKKHTDLEFPNDFIPTYGNVDRTFWQQLNVEIFPQNVLASIYRTLRTPLFLNSALLSLLTSKTKTPLVPIPNDDIQKDLNAACSGLILELGKLFPNTIAAKVVEYPSLASWFGKTAATILRNNLQQTSINEMINKMIQEALPLCESGRPDWHPGRWDIDPQGKKIYVPQKSDNGTIVDDSHCFVFPKNEEEMETHLKKIKGEEEEIEAQLIQKIYDTLVSAIPDHLDDTWTNIHSNIDQFIKNYLGSFILKIKQVLGWPLNWIGRRLLEVFQFLMTPLTSYIQQELMVLSKSIPKIWSHHLNENALYFITDIFRKAVFKPLPTKEEHLELKLAN